jgi:hypothetical protein
MSWCAFTCLKGFFDGDTGKGFSEDIFLAAASVLKNAKGFLLKLPAHI